MGMGGEDRFMGGTVLGAGQCLAVLLALGMVQVLGLQRFLIKVLSPLLAGS